jgi:hypothetical protein
VAETPEGAKPDCGARVPIIGRNHGGDGDQMVGVGCVAQSQHEGDRDGGEERSAVEQRGQPGVQLLDRREEEVEAHFFRLGD